MYFDVIKPFNDCINQYGQNYWSSNLKTYASSVYDTTRTSSPFRQGVEIHTDEDTYSGLVKISVGDIDAGDEHHALRQTNFGQSRLYERNVQCWFEVDSYNPVLYLGANDTTFNTDTLLRIYKNTFPITVSDADRFEYLSRDGVLEPLALRAKAAIFITDIPFFAHDIHGNFDNGNEDWMLRNDVVVEKYELADRTRHKLNYNDTGYDSLVEIGFLSNLTPSISPFDDHDLLSKGIRAVNNQEINSALARMSSLDDTRETQTEVACQAGYHYDFTNTDSLAYADIQPARSSRITLR